MHSVTVLVCRKTSLIQNWLIQNTIYHIFRPITRALFIQKGSEIVKNEHARYMLERFPTDNARVICTKKVSEFIQPFSFALIMTSLELQPFGTVFLLKITIGDSSVQFSSWPQITRWSMHKYIHNVTKVMCALYVRWALSVLQKECRNVWGAHYTLGARYRSENTVNKN